MKKLTQEARRKRSGRTHEKKNQLQERHTIRNKQGKFLKIDRGLPF